MRAPRPVGSGRLLAKPPLMIIVAGVLLAAGVSLWWIAPDLFFGTWRGGPWSAAAPRVSTAPPLDPRDGALLPPDQAIPLAHPCSRNAPPVVRRLWAPSPADVQHLEADLAGFLHAIEDTLTQMPGTPPVQLRAYRRQYAGLELETGERIIYTSAFDPGELQLLAEVGRDSADWRSTPLQVCDGWRGFWGVEYDPAKLRFRGFSFNGIA